jgi:hypothetical protein
MAIEKVVNIDVNIKGTGNALAQTNKLNASLKNLDKTTGDLKTGLKDSGNAILENGGAMGLLNDATGGVAMTIKDAVEATGLFTKGTTIATGAQKIYTLVVGSTTGALKALRIALVSTGLGAIVVLLGLFISKMMESADATEEEKRATDALNGSLQRMSDLYKENISSLETINKERVLRAKIAGASEKEIQRIEAETSKERTRVYKEEQARLLNLLNNKNLDAEQNKKINDDLLANQKAYFKAIEDEKFKDLEGDLSVADAKRQADADLQAKLLENKRKADEEKKKLEEEYQKSLSEGLNEFQIAVNNAQFEQRRLDIENRQAQSDEIARIAYNEQLRLDAELEAEKKRADERKALEESVANAKVDIAFRTADLIKEIAGEGSKVGKALSIAQATISGIEGVQNAFTTASKSPITTLFPAYPFIQAGLAGAFSLLQIKKIASTDPSGKSGAGGSSGASAGASIPSAPSFNLVQGTGANQIAEGLAGQRQPIQAYVVSGAVTSAQQLERNIVNDASL